MGMIDINGTQVEEGMVEEYKAMMGDDLEDTTGDVPVDIPEEPSNGAGEDAEVPGGTEVPEDDDEQAEAPSNDVPATPEMVKIDDKEYSTNDLKSMMGRTRTYQKKYDTIAGSDAYKMGLLMEAVKGGDKGAAKAAFDMLKTSLGKAENDDVLDELEKVEDTFDLDAAFKAATEGTKGDEGEQIFADVIDTEEYGVIMRTMEDEIKQLIPEKVYASYVSNPQSKRALYDVVASGKAPALIEKLDSLISTMPFQDRLAVTSDPDKYAEAFLLVIKDHNKKPAAPSSTTPPKPNGISKGNSRGNAQQATGEVDFTKMTSSEFEKWKRKHHIE